MNINGDLIIDGTNKQLKNVLTTITDSDLPQAHYIFAAGEGNVTKSGSFGSADAPINDVRLTSNTYFSVSNNRIYYTGTKPAIVLATFYANSPGGFNGYMLCGSINGSYTQNIGFVDANINGQTAVSSQIIRIENGQYITFSVGRANAFSDLLFRSRISAFIIDFEN